MLLALVVFPALYYLAILLAKWYSGTKTVSMREMFLAYSYMLVPMGLLAWIAFSIPLIMVNGSYIISVISDPLGWGMNLFGTADFPWTPFKPHWVPFLQVGVLLVGLYYSLRGLHRVAAKLLPDRIQRNRSLVPPAALLFGITLVFLKLFIG